MAGDGEAAPVQDGFGGVTVESAFSSVTEEAFIKDGDAVKDIEDTGEADEYGDGHDEALERVPEPGNADDGIGEEEVDLRPHDVEHEGCMEWPLFSFCFLPLKAACKGTRFELYLGEMSVLMKCVS